MKPKRILANIVIDEKVNRQLNDLCAALDFNRSQLVRSLVRIVWCKKFEQQSRQKNKVAAE
jgi:hypothetical protein